MGARHLEQSLRIPAADGRVGVVPFVTLGFPSVQTSLELILAFERVGVDAVEIGVPFSDPLADGTTIQRASLHALDGGVTLRTCLQGVSELRKKGLKIPVVLMGYYNPILALGLERATRDAALAGVDGFIVADLPNEEAAPLRLLCADREIALVPLLAPTSTDDRVREASVLAQGFVYCVSLTGVTGARLNVSDQIVGLVGRVRQHTDLPIAIGFGISSREHVEAVGQHADAAIIGSALLEAIARAPLGQESACAGAYLKRLIGISVGRRA
jgi:tryptophan synthase alpha chain